MLLCLMLKYTVYYHLAADQAALRNKCKHTSPLSQQQEASAIIRYCQAYSILLSECYDSLSWSCALMVSMACCVNPIIMLNGRSAALSSPFTKQTISGVYKKDQCYLTQPIYASVVSGTMSDG